MTSLETLKQRKQEWIKYFEDLENSYKEGRITKQEYLDTQHKTLKGQFKEDFLKHIDDEIARQQKELKNKKKIKILSGIIVAWLVITIAVQLGITGLVTLGQQTNAILPINQEYTENTTEDLTFITTTSLKVSGKIYGKGQTWIYLVDNLTQRLVYYADTSSSFGITGLVTGTPINETNNSNSTINSTANETISETSNITINETANATVNETNSTIATNSTINETNSIETNTPTASNTTATNSTNTTIVPEPIIPEVFEPSIITKKSTYNIGDNVSYKILPEGATGTIYLHAPSDSYILNELYWIAQEPGNHTLTGLITLGEETERTETSFNVNKKETATISEACVETCTMQETPVTLLIITQGTTLQLESITYTPTDANATNQTNETGPVQIIKTLTGATNTTNETVEPVVPQDPRALLRSCLAANVNTKPRRCFSDEAWQEKFPERNFKLVNDLGQTMASVDGQGNMKIRGILHENAAGEPQQFDMVVPGVSGIAAWIDVLSGDLYLRGSVQENQETLLWTDKRDDVVTNGEGMYLSIFHFNTGNLALRGQLIQGETI